MTDRRAQARSFGAAAGAYERGRPPYPDEAIDWMLPPGARRVLDLGAGTGKLTRQLLERRLDVVAVEPIAEMRAELRRAVPAAEVLEGTAEAIPLPDSSVDAVLVAQAWHWVDPALAVPEVARVLRPRGRIGLAWNTRDESVPWLAELGRLMVEAEGQSTNSVEEIEAQVGPPFTPLERLTVRWTHAIEPDSLLDMVASRSYVILMPEADRNLLMDGVRRLVATHPDLAGAERAAVPFVTLVYRADLAAD